MHHPNRKSKSSARLAQMMALLAVGILIVGLTAWTIISLTTPPQPEVGEIAPPQNNTPFVGKKW